MMLISAERGCVCAQKESVVLRFVLRGLYTYMGSIESAGANEAYSHGHALTYESWEFDSISLDSAAAVPFGDC
jgi:hypothetical protein